MVHKILRRIRTWLRNMSLFKKMLFFYVMILCIPMLIISGSYIRNLSRELNMQYINNKEKILEQAQGTIENAIAQIEYCRNSFQYNSAFLEYVNGYDFSTGEGAQMWLEHVKPAFEQIGVANKSFSEICVWRVNPKNHNDPRYVLNAKDNVDLREGNVPVKYNDKTFFLEAGYQDTKCRIYQALFDVNAFRKIGYVEVECDFDWLFSGLNFMEAGELLQVSCEQGKYNVRQDESGKIYLSAAKTDPDKRMNRSCKELDEIKTQLDYYYPDISIWSDRTVIMILCGTIVLFAFFTGVYYAIYLSVTKRIVLFSKHMQFSNEEKMEPFPEAESKDEIGVMIQTYNRMADRLNRLNEEIIQKVTLANHARYYAMQSQIQPHFLYNTLENIDMLIELGENETASKMMNLFSKILRYNLSYEKTFATIEGEMKHVEEYLKLHAFRMRDDFEYSVEMEPACGGVDCPYCMLQPVVENCFKHGFKNQERHLWIHVRAWCENGFVWIVVEDNGSGISQERFLEVEKSLNQKEMQIEDGREKTETVHIGLNNVNERIRLLCGRGSGLWVEQKTQGCKVRIAINMYEKGGKKCW